MALVVETGIGLAGANAYLSVADADTYFTARLNTVWTAAATASKEAAIIKATQYIDAHYRHGFKGLRMTGVQALEWPRTGVLDDSGFTSLNACVPAELKAATAELALRALSAELEPDLDRGGLVESVTAGPISQTFMAGAPGGKTYPFVNELLGRLLDFTPGSGVRVTRL